MILTGVCQRHLQTFMLVIEERRHVSFAGRDTR